ncbi:hypothetical protein Poly24_29720 [Rosistilla carotiformis]|uniref:VTC domain-containing protein n=1 Tax=Rosistilla carotiformis TaxID=2528017 RepID=A0A518JUP5_9BACT|nr:VTC domain-containing protein [Rosistilla carotiformis]QDV69257.1 hypothetical protein Poly24_29720 [Rosistilla carotiformis]
MKYSPRSEYTFVLTDAVGESVLAAVRRDGAPLSTVDCLEDRYYVGKPSKRPSSKLRQYRIRRFGCCGATALECKRWKDDVATLRQTHVDAHDLGQLDLASVDKKWVGKWFHKEIVKKQLSPRLKIGFERTVLFPQASDNCRLTLDRNIRVDAVAGDGTSGIAIAADANLVSLQETILRMKFTDALPLRFKRLLYEFQLLPVPPTTLLTLAQQQIASTKTTPVASPNQAGTLNQETIQCHLG